MRKSLAGVATAASVAAGFAGGIGYASLRSHSIGEQRKERALLCVMSHLAMASTLDRGDFTEVRKLVDSYIDEGLRSLPRNTGYIENKPEWQKAKVRTLNGVAIL